jgi:hypothetical protein
MTCVTPLTSIPRPATSVATKISYLRSSSPALKLIRQQHTGDGRGASSNVQPSINQSIHESIRQCLHHRSATLQMEARQIRGEHTFEHDRIKKARHTETRGSLNIDQNRCTLPGHGHVSPTHGQSNIPSQGLHALILAAVSVHDRAAVALLVQFAREGIARLLGIAKYNHGWILLAHDGQLHAAQQRRQTKMISHHINQAPTCMLESCQASPHPWTRKSPSVTSSHHAAREIPATYQPTPFLIVLQERDGLFDAIHRLHVPITNGNVGRVAQLYPHPHAPTHTHRHQHQKFDAKRSQASNSLASMAPS